MATIDELKNKADLVYNATTEGENTATRIGGALQDAASLIESLQSGASSTDTALTTETSERKAADTTIQTNIDNEASARTSADKTLQDNIDAHTSDKSNPHGVTAAQVGYNSDLVQFNHSASEDADGEKGITIEYTDGFNKDSSVTINYDEHTAGTAHAGFMSASDKAKLDTLNVDSDGIIDSGNLPDTFPWSGISDKPTTIAGYGITDKIVGYTVLDDTSIDSFTDFSKLGIYNGSLVLSSSTSGKTPKIYYQYMFTDGTLKVRSKTDLGSSIVTGESVSAWSDWEDIFATVSDSDT